MINLRGIVLFGAALLIFASVFFFDPSVSKNKEATQTQNSSGNLVIYHIGSVPVELRPDDDYGVMLVNDGGPENPIPRYILAEAKSRTVLDTRDLALFKSALARIPKGATLLEYGSCTVSRAYGLTEEQRQAYDSLFPELGLKISEEPRITCYCQEFS